MLMHQPARKWQTLCICERFSPPLYDSGAMGPEQVVCASAFAGAVLSRLPERGQGRARALVLRDGF